MEEPFDYRLKLVMLGDSGVGKTSVMTRFCKSQFPDSARTTIYTDFVFRDVSIEGKVLRSQVWDTAGQERYRVVTAAYYRDAAGALLVYDITNPKSFANIEVWLSELRALSEPLEIVLLGNKSDLGSDRKVSYEEGHDLAEKNDFGFMETSAKDATNVENAFQMLVARVYLKKIKKATSLQLPRGIQSRRVSLYWEQGKDGQKLYKKNCCIV